MTFLSLGVLTYKVGAAASVSHPEWNGTRGEREGGALASAPLAGTFPTLAARHGTSTRPLRQALVSP